MELLYFINGIMFMGIVYGVYHIQNIKSSNNKLTQQNQLIKNLTTLKHAEIQESVDDTRDLVARIEEQMTKDNYSNFTEINKELVALKAKTESLTNSHSQLTKESQDNISNAFSEISQIKVIIKAIQQGALQSRY